MRTKNGFDLKHSALLIQLMIIGLLFVLIACMLSCNNKPGETTKIENAQKDTGTNATVKTHPAFSAGSFVVLKLDKQQLINLFDKSNKKDPKKLLIQFSGSITDNYIKATAFNASNKNNNYEQVQEEMSAALANVWSLPGVNILGNNELRIGLIKKLLGIKKGDPINNSNSKDLYFYPQRDETNHIYFVVSPDLIPFSGTDAILNTKLLPGGFQNTNPSPPKPPCDGPDCDTQ